MPKILANPHSLDWYPTSVNDAVNGAARGGKFALTASSSNPTLRHDTPSSSLARSSTDARGPGSSWLSSGGEGLPTLVRGEPSRANPDPEVLYGGLDSVVRGRDLPDSCSVVVDAFKWPLSYDSMAALYQ